jgi:hypothetical protein
MHAAFLLILSYSMDHEQHPDMSKEIIASRMQNGNSLIIGIFYL